MSFSPLTPGQPTHFCKYPSLTPYEVEIKVYHADPSYNHFYSSRMYAPDDIVAKVICRRMADAFFSAVRHYISPGAKMGFCRVINADTEELVYSDEECWEV